MGADTFYNKAKGETAEKAFIAALDEARYQYGNRGYTGSLAEKHSFVMIEMPKGLKEAHQSTSDYDTAELAFAEKLISDSDPRVDDKRGPAGCIKITDGEYLFFGWASS